MTEETGQAQENSFANMPAWPLAQRWQQQKYPAPIVVALSVEMAKMGSGAFC